MSGVSPTTVALTSKQDRPASLLQATCRCSSTRRVASSTATCRTCLVGKARTEFHLLSPERGGRAHAVASGYRPAWRSDRKPDWNDAAIKLESDGEIHPGDKAGGWLLPGSPHLWTGKIVPGDRLEGGEGSRIVGPTPAPVDCREGAIIGGTGWSPTAPEPGDLARSGGGQKDTARPPRDPALPFGPGALSDTPIA